MSNVLMEAIALGRPIAASEVEGTRELLAEEARSWLVPPGDATRLADAITNLLQASPTTQTLVEANQRNLFSDFTQEKTIAAYTRLYERVLAQWDTANFTNL